MSIVLSTKFAVVVNIHHSTFMYSRVLVIHAIQNFIIQYCTALKKVLEFNWPKSCMHKDTFLLLLDQSPYRAIHTRGERVIFHYLCLYACMRDHLSDHHIFTTLYMDIEEKEGKREEENGAAPSS